MARKSSPVTTVAILLSFVLLCFSGTVQAQIIYVDTDAPGADNGLSWADAYNYLQDALNAVVASDEIRVAEGTYTPDQGAGVTAGDRYATFQLINGVTIKGGYAGFSQPNPDANDVGLYETILSGDLAGNDGANFANNTENSYQVVTGSGADATAVLDGFTITAGNANGTGMYRYGSGVYNDQGSPTLANCTVSENWARLGGGLYDTNSNPTLSNCTFSDNWPDAMDNYDSSPTLNNCAFSGNFKAMHNDNSSPILTGCAFSNNDRGMYNIESSPTLTNCAFTSNNGAMSNWGGSNPTLTNCTFTQNASTGNGGAMYNENANPVLTDCAFTANSASASGGAIYDFNSNPTLTNCTFTENSAGLHGGAIRNFKSNPQLTNCTFTANSANEDGGAIGNSQSSPTVRNCLFNENVSIEEGGAIMNNRSAPVLFNCTFVDNTAGVGGNALAFFSYLNDPPSSLQASNCIFWDGGDEIWKNEETDISITYSDVQGGWDGIGNLDTDPLFVDAAVDDYHLLSGSPCIDAGDPAYVSAPGETDLDGQPRVIGDRIDMGVYEHTSAVPIEVGISPGVINLKSKGKWITALLTFPEGYDVADVDTATILLQGQIQMQELAWSDEVTREIMVRFSREVVQGVLSVGNVEVTITGRFMDGTPFKGSAIVKVMNKGGKK